MHLNKQFLDKSVSFQVQTVLFIKNEMGENGSRSFYKFHKETTTPHQNLPSYFKLDDAMYIIGARDGQDSRGLVVGRLYVTPCVRVDGQEVVVVDHLSVVEPASPVHTHRSGYIRLPLVAGPAQMRDPNGIAIEVDSVRFWSLWACDSLL